MNLFISNIEVVIKINISNEVLHLILSWRMLYLNNLHTSLAKSMKKALKGDTNTACWL